MKIKMNTQTDHRWKNKKMILDQTLGYSGCLVTAISNVIQLFENKVFTPDDLNKFLYKNNGYIGVENYPKRGTLKPEKLKKLGYRYLFLGKQNYDNKCLIAKVRVNSRTHFVNCWGRIFNDFVCFDVYNGITSIYSDNEIIGFRKLVVI